MQKGPKEYARAAIETMMRRFAAADLPPKGGFHYHQGVLLMGVYENWRLDKEAAWFQYMKDWVDSMMDGEDETLQFVRGYLDNIQPGNLLFPLYEATAEEKYRRAMDALMDELRHYPVNSEGGFWHMAVLPDQMWLDGLYMAGPFMCKYASRFGLPEYFDAAILQICLMREKTRDERTGLWYHACDCSKAAEWADPETGRSSEFWGRSIGWVPVAVLEELDYIPKDHPRRREVCCLITELLTAICRFQSEEGRWYQVVDKGGCAGNWLENSCSCLYVAAICKAVRDGLLSADYLEQAWKGYEGIIRSLNWEGSDLLIGHVCIGTGVGDYRHYCERPTAVNDLHGVGAFLLMCAQIRRTFGDGYEANQKA